MKKRLSILSTILLSIVVLVGAVLVLRVSTNLFARIHPTPQAGSAMPGTWTVAENTFRFNRDGTGTTTYADRRTDSFVWQERNGRLTIQVRKKASAILDLLGGRATSKFIIDSVGSNAVQLTKEKNGNALVMTRRIDLARMPNDNAMEQRDEHKVAEP